MLVSLRYVPDGLHTLQRKQDKNGFCIEPLEISAPYCRAEQRTSEASDVLVRRAEQRWKEYDTTYWECPTVVWPMPLLSWYLE